MSLAIIPGSYDPPTLGHVELIRYGAIAITTFTREETK